MAVANAQTRRRRTREGRDGRDRLVKGTRVRTRPCWIVIAKGTAKQLAPEIRRISGQDADDADDEDDAADDGWVVLDGAGTHVAIVEYAPGSECAGDEELAKALSRRTKAPAYVLWMNDEAPRVQVFERGAYAGDVINAWPDSVASSLKCEIPGVRYDQRAKRGKLVPEKSPDAKPGELTLARWTIAQWLYLMRSSDWSVMIDGAGDETVTEVLAALDHRDAKVRAVACKLVGAMGTYSLKQRGNACVARLGALAAGDPDKRVRAEAKQVAADLAEQIEREAIRAEFPWITNFRSDAVTTALAALDDPRPAVRLEVASWFAHAWELTASVRRKALVKLTRLAERATDKSTRQVLRGAIERMGEDR
jgi:hypothetical protein